MDADRTASLDRSLTLTPAARSASLRSAHPEDYGICSFTNGVFRDIVRHLMRWDPSTTTLLALLRKSAVEAATVLGEGLERHSDRNVNFYVAARKVLAFLRGLVSSEMQVWRRVRRRRRRRRRRRLSNSCTHP